MKTSSSEKIELNFEEKIPKINANSHYLNCTGTKYSVKHNRFYYINLFIETLEIK